MRLIEQKKYAKTDDAGNALYFVVNEIEGRPESGEIHLQLAGEKKTRRIGHYSFADRTLFVKRDPALHLHRKTSSYGFNYAILKETDLFQIQTIKLRDTATKSLYCFPAAIVFEYGRILYFKQQGFELQYFVPVERLGRYLVKEEKLEG